MQGHKAGGHKGVRGERGVRAQGQEGSRVQGVVGCKGLNPCAFSLLALMPVCLHTPQALIPPHSRSPRAQRAT